MTRLRAGLREYSDAVPIYLARHVIGPLLGAQSTNGSLTELALNDLSSEPVFAFAGIGNPRSFHKQLARANRSIVGFRAFPDHHAYSAGDMAAVQIDAKRAGAEMLVTTEKDWAKLRAVPSRPGDLPIYRLGLSIEFPDGDGEKLLAKVIKMSSVKSGGNG